MVLAAVALFAVLALALAIVILIDLSKAKKQKQRYHVHEAFSAYLLLLPAIFLGFFFVMLPIFLSLGYAFTDFYLLKPNAIHFVGFANFATLFQEFSEKGEIFLAFRNTGIFVLLVVPLQILLALGMALFVNNKHRGNIVFKICFFAPVAVSLSVTSYLWLQILSPNPSGMMNSFLAQFGVPAQDFLGNKNTAMLWIVLLSAWQGAGYQMLIFLSALGGIPEDLYAAASLDGAHSWRKFKAITLPALRPTFLYVLITVFIGACRVMIQPMLLTGYQDQTLTVSYYMYQQGFTYRFVGLSSAVALLMTIIIGAITLLQRRLLRGKENQ